MRHAHPLPALLLAVALAGCMASSPRPVVNANDAARHSAELTAAQVDHDATLAEAEAARLAGTLAGESLERVREAGRELDAALLRAHAELQVYLSSGVESEAFRTARAAMNQKRVNLSLVWEAAKP